mgnify:CR=1 FL=1
MLLHVLIFQSNDDSVINQGRIIHTGTVNACTFSADYVQWICPLVVYFFMVKREHNAVPKFFKMFSVFQMMFIKEVILIQWEFLIAWSASVRVERRDQVAQFIRQKQI